MNATTDMEDCELRDQFGNPPIASGRDTNHASGASVVMVDSSRLLPLVMLSCFLSGGAVLGVLLLALLLPPLIDSRAEARVARAEALAELARKESSTAKDMMDVERAKRIAREELKNVR